MPAPVYSLRIFCGAVNVASGTVGPIVPPGFIYVLRDVDINTETGAAGDVFTVLSPLNLNLFIVRTSDPQGGTNRQWRGRQVYSPGEKVGFKSFGGTWDVMASGYQLSLP